MEFCNMQNSLCVQILCSPILQALLHGTRAVSVCKSLRRDTRNEITELFAEGATYIWLGSITFGIGPHF